MLTVLDKSLNGFYVSNKDNFQNYFVNTLVRWFEHYTNALQSL